MTFMIAVNNLKWLKQTNRQNKTKLNRSEISSKRRLNEHRMQKRRTKIKRHF
jgi:hypothetical protein